MAGCIGNGGQENYLYQDYQSSSGPAENDSPFHLEVDLDPEVSSQFFKARGSLTIQGNRTLPYLILNATLQKDGRSLESTRYMLIEVEPKKEYAFDISKNMRLMPGDYRCILEAFGPNGQLAFEDRECRIVEPFPVEPLSELLSGPPSGRKSSPQPVTEREEEPFQAEEELQEISGTSKEISENAKEAAESNVDPSEEKPSMEMTSGYNDNDSGNDSGSESQKVSERENKEIKEPDIRAKPEAATVQENALVGSTSSTKYHRPECRYAVKIRPENRIYFASVEEAENKGYKPCKACSP